MLCDTVAAVVQCSSSLNNQVVMFPLQAMKLERILRDLVPAWAMHWAVLFPSHSYSSYVTQNTWKYTLFQLGCQLGCTLNKWKYNLIHVKQFSIHDRNRPLIESKITLEMKCIDMRFASVTHSDPKGRTIDAPLGRMLYNWPIYGFIKNTLNITFN